MRCDQMPDRRTALDHHYTLVRKAEDAIRQALTSLYREGGIRAEAVDIDLRENTFGLTSITTDTSEFAE